MKPVLIDGLCWVDPSLVLRIVEYEYTFLLPAIYQKNAGLDEDRFKFGDRVSSYLSTSVTLLFAVSAQFFSLDFGKQSGQICNNTALLVLPEK